MRPKISRVVRETAFLVEGVIKESMQGPKSGRKYGGHQASAPGEAPAIDYGTLVNSIQVEMVNDLQAIVYTNTEYAVGLELGTVHIRPRPFMEPGAMSQKAAFIAKIKANLMEM
jgi:phage gpG-like protein